MYVRMYGHTDTYPFVCMHACINVYIYTHTRAHTRAHIRIYIPQSLAGKRSICVCLYYISMYMYIYKNNKKRHTTYIHRQLTRKYMHMHVVQVWFLTQTYLRETIHKDLILDASSCKRICGQRYRWCIPLAHWQILRVCVYVYGLCMWAHVCVHACL